MEQRFQSLRTLLRVDFLLDEEVDCCDDQVGDDVEASHTQEDLRVVKGNLLGDLHHAKNNHQIGTVEKTASASLSLLQCCAVWKLKELGPEKIFNSHLRI